MLLACGINHKTAPIDIREKLAMEADQQKHYLMELIASAPVEEAAILSTCNRTELYCNTAHTREVLSYLSSKHRLDQNQLRDHIYVHRNVTAVRHLMRVACGLDSMLIGEPQILGQMKKAYQHAASIGTMGTHLDAVFQRVFAVTKRVRTTTNLNVNAISLAYLCVSLIRRIFENLAKRKVLLIGAGETIELIARHCYEHQVRDFVVINRTIDNAKIIAEQFDAIAASFADLPAHVASADIIVCATASPIPVLGKGLLESAMQTKKHTTKVLIDLGVPRDIEPEIGNLRNVFLYNVDDLQTILQDNISERHDAALQAEAMIELEVDAYVRWQRSLLAVNNIRDFREQAIAFSQEELDRALLALNQHKDPHDVVRELTHRLTQKILHQPTQRLRKAGYDGRQDILKSARFLFEKP